LFRIPFAQALEKNARWQSYNGEREQYVGALLAKYQQVSTQLQECRDRLAQVTSNPGKAAASRPRVLRQRFLSR